MREKELLSIIEDIAGKEFIGDDCAYLKDLGIVVTQDSLVEGIHFSTDYTTPYQLGYKSVMVNISDIAASGAESKYITISLSLPNDKQEKFVEDFYKGVKKACGDNIKVVGGDITGSDKIYISVCAIGTSKNRNISSRSNAKIGYKVVISGVHGSSCAGLKILNSEVKNNNENFADFIKAHLEPAAQENFGQKVGETVKESYAMMDTSDGLMDALITIADKSNVSLEVDFSKIPHDKDIEQFKDWENMVLFGGEDYGIVAAIPDKYEVGGVTIGRVKAGEGVDLLKNGKTIHLTQKEVEDKIFNHFG